ncbi:purine-nucleoside phosphorylase, partial [bacterium]|nr:purine-nucleoside phosphorylase [bacterium]
IGANDDSLGTRFPDMSEIYKKYLVELAEQSAKETKIEVQSGVYAATTGPCYETPAEVRMLRTLGADAAGMSTVPEAIVANYCGMDVLGISCISNYAAGVSDKKLCHEEVIETTNIAKNKFKTLLLKILEKI